jgi:PPP family 3-phenylpropionic acid transporter
MLTSGKPGIIKLKINPLVDARAMYCFYYMALGAFMPFINLYYERMGLSGLQIGTLAALPVLIAVFFTFIWGAVADGLRLHNFILRGALIMAPLVVFTLSRSSHFASLIPLVLVYALVTSPIVPLLDSNALEVAQEHHSSFGEIRVWGSIGWALATWLMGMMIELLNIHWLFYGYILFMAVTFLLALFQAPRKLRVRDSLTHGLRALFQRDFIVFLVSIFLLNSASSGASQFFSLYMDKIGAGESMIGLSWALAALSELPVMLFSAVLLRRFGSDGLLKIAFLIFIVRWWLYSVINIPGWALVVQCLHGFSFAAFLVGAVTFVSERSPEGFSTTALAIYNTVAFGLASMAGSMIGGLLYDSVGSSQMFRVFSLLGVGGLAIFLLAGKRKTILTGG